MALLDELATSRTVFTTAAQPNTDELRGAAHHIFGRYLLGQNRRCAGTTE